jgi:hypothetical protein
MCGNGHEIGQKQKHRAQSTGRRAKSRQKTKGKRKK